MADQRRLVVTKNEDDNIIGIDEAFHDNSNTDVWLNMCIGANHRPLAVTERDDNDIFGFDETS